jgi:hypothetical protein
MGVDTLSILLAVAIRNIVSEDIRSSLGENARFSARNAGLNLGGKGELCRAGGAGGPEAPNRSSSRVEWFVVRAGVERSWMIAY